MRKIPTALAFNHAGYFTLTLAVCLWLFGGMAHAGTCPSGANYLSLSSPAANGYAGSVTLGSGSATSSAITTCFYSDSVAGSDSNTGADEAHPFQYVKGMPNCSANCAAVTTSATTGWIIKGGSHYHRNSGSPLIGGQWSVPALGYVGVDPAWFSGGSFARPIIDQDNPLSTSLVASCTFEGTNTTAVSLAANTVFDRIEITGMCSADTGGAGNGGTMISVSGGDVIERLYEHGWTMTTGSQDDRLFGTSGSGSNRYLFIDINGIDSSLGTVCTTSSCIAACWNGSPTVPGTCATGWLMEDCDDVEYSVLKHGSQGCEASTIHIWHDNDTEYITEPGFGAPCPGSGCRHGNVLEPLAMNGTTSIQVYNNIFCNVNDGQNTNLNGTTMYIYNNVWCNDGHFPPDSNGLFLEPFSNNSAGFLTAFIYNNTFDSTVGGSTRLGSTTAGSPLTFANNHVIGRTSPITNLFSCSNCTFTESGGEVFMPTGTATSQGYTLANHFAPTLVTNGTVHAGINLSSSCGGNFSVLCSGTTASVTEGSGDGGLIPNYPATAANARGTTFDAGAYQFSASVGSFTCSPSPVPANHSGHIALSCTGVGTTWTNSTIFTVTGLAGTSLVSYSNSSNTLETVTITTGAAVGSAAVNDATDSISAAVTVATATLSISPTSGNANTTPLLTLTGTNTLWSSEVASTLFSVSGASCSGDSLATPAVTSNTAATATLTTGGALCTITVRDNSTTATATFTVTGNWLVRVTVAGVGSVSDSLGYFTNCTLNCTALIPNGSVDTLTETTSLPYVNAGFSSPCPVTVESNLPCTVTITSATSIAASFLTPQLPQTWVNSGEYVGKTTNLVNFPTFWLCGATRYPASGNYANSQAGLQAAINDAETCRTNTGAGTQINIPPVVYSGTAGINLPQTAGDTSSNFIVLTSSTPLRSGVTACSHGIQDNIPSATQPGLRNIGCTGTNMYYQLGPTINTVPVGAFTLANGQSSNTASYNDVSSMYTIEATGNNSNAIQTCATFTGNICTSGWDTNNVGPHHYAILNAELRPSAGLTGPAAPFSIGQGSETQFSQIPTHIHLAYSYLHGDWTDAPMTGCPSACAATAGPTGANSLPNIVVFSGCIYCSLMYNYMDRALRPGSEGHAISLLLAQQLKIAHNWVEGQSIGRFCGGQASQIMIPGFLGCQDVEERGNRYTYPFSWILANGSGTLRQVNKNGAGVGSGYLVGDVITIVEAGAAGGTATVNTVGAGGTLLTMTPLALGSGYVIAAGLSVTGGTGTGGLVNITTGYFPNGGTTNNYVRKNGSEQKVSERFLSDGNIFENVDGSGAQNGTVMSGKTDNNSNVTAVANNWITTENITYSNLILRGSCNGPSWGYRSNTVGGDGNGTTLPTQKAIWQNVLLYWYGINNPGCGGVSPQFGFRFASGGTAAIWPSGQVAASRNAAGIVTLTLTSSLAPDLSVSSTNVGDPVNVFGCTTDPTFNTGNTNQGPPALPGTLVNGLTVVYQSTTLGVSSDNTCSFNNGQGWPNYTIVNHISDFSTTPGTQNDPQSSSLAGTNPYNFIRNTYITNAVVVGGGFNSTFAEGTRTETKAFDALSLVFNNTVMAGRDSVVTCPGHASPAPGGMAACYTEYTNTFQAITPATVYGAPSGNCTGATPSASCLGIVGAMSQSSFPTFLSDFTQYRLCHASDAATCSGTPSVFASGQSSQSPDGTDLGVNMPSILTAETSVLYSCTTPCGSGPFLDVGAIIPASAPQVMGDNVIQKPVFGNLQ